MTEFLILLYGGIGSLTTYRAATWGRKDGAATTGVIVVSTAVGLLWPLWWLFLTVLVAAGAIIKARRAGEQS